MSLATTINQLFITDFSNLEELENNFWELIENEKVPYKEVNNYQLMLENFKKEYNKNLKNKEEEERKQKAEEWEEENPPIPTKEELTNIFEERLSKLTKKNSDLLQLFLEIKEYTPRAENPYLVKPKKPRAKKGEGKQKITFKSGKEVPNWTTKTGWLLWEEEGHPCFYCDKCVEVIGKVPKKSCFPTQKRLDNHKCPN